jgi:hypothetical protein
VVAGGGGDRYERRRRRAKEEPKESYAARRGVSFFVRVRDGALVIFNLCAAL